MKRSGRVEKAIRKIQSEDRKTSLEISGSLAAANRKYDELVAKKIIPPTEPTLFPNETSCQSLYVNNENLQRGCLF